MVPNEQAYYLRLTLREQNAARKSTSAEERKRHEELAIAYEIRCLLNASRNFPIEEVEPAA
jgi:hypothetical protein